MRPGCRIDTAARTVTADAIFDGDHNPLPPSSRHTWPIARAKDGSAVDLSQIPPAELPRQLLAYLDDFDSGWYAITNPDLELGVGVVWPADLYPYAWFFQEMHASSGWPWYRRTFMCAIEPSSSVPGHGLAEAAKTGTHRTLLPGASETLELVVVLFQSRAGARSINANGAVETAD